MSILISLSLIVFELLFDFKLVQKSKKKHTLIRLSAIEHVQYNVGD